MNKCLSGRVRWAERGASVAFSSFKRIWYLLAELTQDKTARQACGRPHVRVAFFVVKDLIHNLIRVE